MSWIVAVDTRLWSDDSRPRVDDQSPPSNHWMSEYGCSTPMATCTFVVRPEAHRDDRLPHQDHARRAFVVEHVGEDVVVHEQRRGLADQERAEVDPGEPQPQRERAEGAGGVAVEEVHFDPGLDRPVHALPRRLGVEAEPRVPRRQNGVLPSPCGTGNARGHEVVGAADRVEVVDAVEPDEAVPLVLGILEVGQPVIGIDPEPRGVRQRPLDRLLPDPSSGCPMASLLQQCLPESAFQG